MCAFTSAVIPVPKRGAAGTDGLAKSAQFEPIPCHANIEKDGAQTGYRIKKGGEEIRQAFIEYREKEFEVKRRPLAEYDYAHAVIVDGKNLVIASVEKSDYVRAVVASANAKDKEAMGLGNSAPRR